MIIAEMKFENEITIKYDNLYIEIYDGDISKGDRKYIQDAIKNIKETKGYKYFIEDCIRFSEIDIVQYLVELTYDGVTEWKETDEIYTTSYGDEIYKLSGNELSFSINGYINGELILGSLNRLQKAINRQIPGYKEKISIYDLVVKCSFKEMNSIEDELYPIDAYVLVDNIEHKINAYYSKTKDEYFVYRRSFEFAGNPYCKVLNYTKYLERNKSCYDSDFDLNPQSILYMYGYNATDNISQEKRQKILVFLIETRIMDWFEIINHLEFLIEFHELQGHRKAVKIWETDIDFIRDYVSKNEHIIYLSDKYV